LRRFDCLPKKTLLLLFRIIKNYLMTSKERFDLTVHHKQPDRMVVDFGGTSVTGIHVLAIERLRYYQRAGDLV